MDFRVLRRAIVPRLEKGSNVLISAHGDSLRALVKHLNRISDKDISELNIPTGIPLAYELDKNLTVLNHRYLGDPESVKTAVDEVARQAETGEDRT